MSVMKYCYGTHCHTRTHTHTHYGPNRPGDSPEFKVCSIVLWDPDGRNSGSPTRSLTHSLTVAGPRRFQSWLRRVCVANSMVFIHTFWSALTKHIRSCFKQAIFEYKTGVYTYKNIQAMFLIPMTNLLELVSEPQPWFTQPWRGDTRWNATEIVPL